MVIQPNNLGKATGVEVNQPPSTRYGHQLARRNMWLAYTLDAYPPIASAGEAMATEHQRCDDPQDWAWSAPCPPSCLTATTTTATTTT